MSIMSNMSAISLLFSLCCGFPGTPGYPQFLSVCARAVKREGAGVRSARSALSAAGRESPSPAPRGGYVARAAPRRCRHGWSPLMRVVQGYQPERERGRGGHIEPVDGRNPGVGINSEGPQRHFKFHRAARGPRPPPPGPICGGVCLPPTRAIDNGSCPKPTHPPAPKQTPPGPPPWAPPWVGCNDCAAPSVSTSAAALAVGGRSACSPTSPTRMPRP